MWINWRHLRDAKKVSGRTGNAFSIYMWHWFMAMKEFFFLVWVCVGSLIHAFFPFIFDFKLLEWRINRLKVLKKQLPEDPALKKVKFEDD